MHVVEQDERLFHHIRQLHLGPRRERVFGRQRHHQRFAVEFLDVEAVVADRQGHEPDVEFTRQKVGEKSLGQVLFELELHRGVFLAEPRDRGRQHERRDRRDRADAELPALPRVADRRPGLADGRAESRARPSSCPASSARPSAESVEQTATQAVLLAFESEDLLAERGLCDPLALRGSRETARLRDRDEVTKLVNFHRRFRSSPWFKSLPPIVASFRGLWWPVARRLAEWGTIFQRR